MTNAVVTEITLFCVALILGVLFGVINRLINAIFKRINSRSGFVATQFLIGGGAVIGLTLSTYLLNDGNFTLYSVFALIIGCIFSSKIQIRHS